MLEIILNGQQKTLFKAQTLQVLLDELGITLHYVAIAINQVVVDGSKYTTTWLNNGDEITILTPMQGG